MRDMRRSATHRQQRSPPDSSSLINSSNPPPHTSARPSRIFLRSLLACALLMLPSCAFCSRLRLFTASDSSSPPPADAFG